MQGPDNGSEELREAFIENEEDFALYRARHGSVSLCKKCEARKSCHQKFGVRG